MAAEHSKQTALSKYSRFPGSEAGQAGRGVLGVTRYSRQRGARCNQIQQRGARCNKIQQRGARCNKIQQTEGC